jgi:hypothetical protein
VATAFAENPYGTWFHGEVVDMFYFPIWEGNLPSWLPVWGGKHFTFVCLAAGVTPEWVRSKIKHVAVVRYDKEKR